VGTAENRFFVESLSAEGEDRGGDSGEPVYCSNRCRLREKTGIRYD